MKFRILSIALLAATLFGSCNKENDTPDKGLPVEFSTEITRASGTTWDANDAIGIFMFKNGTSTVVENASNVKYTTEGTKFTGTPIYYPQSGNVDFVAYYPWRSSLTNNTYKVDVSTQTTPADIDLLYSNNATDKSKGKTAVRLVFDHKLSRLVLNIAKGADMASADLPTIRITIEGMPTKADFDLENGAFENLSGTTTAITPIVATTTSGFAATYDAIVIPQGPNSYTGRKITFTIGADSDEYAIPDAEDFLSGKSHAYTLTVNKTGIIVSRGAITDWTGIGNSEDLGEALQIDLPQMVKIPAGSFQMGSPKNEPGRYTDEVQHKVTLTKDFYMSRYAITFAQYDAFCEATERSKASDSDWGRGNRPVINVSRNDAVAYCEWLSGQTGATWRLPTEAEWEYACRGDYANKPTETATKPFAVGDGSKLYADMANFDGTSPYELPEGEIKNFTGNANHPATYHKKTMPVGSYAANSYGLYDMHGSIYEWCLDKYTVAYEDLSPIDPVNISPDNLWYSIRGGSWNFKAEYCRSAARGDYNPDNKVPFVGFRVVFVP